MNAFPTLEHQRILPSSAGYWKGIDVAVFAAKPGTGEGQRPPTLIPSAVSTNFEKTFQINLGAAISQWPDFLAKPGEIIEIPIDDKKFSLSRVLIVGVGSSSAQDFQKAGIALSRKVKNSGKQVLNALLAQREKPSASDRQSAITHMVALILSSYVWNMKTKAAPETAKFRIAGSYQNEITRALILGEAVWNARDLIHTPSNIKTPAWMATQAKKLIAKTKSTDYSISVLSGKDLLPFGGLSAIGNSSPNPGPRFIEISYAPKGSRNWPHVVLVGKGITYDTGGISLKRPYDVMAPMKSDMAGAAAVLATISAMAKIAPKVRVTSLMMCAENMLSATSTRPSDVITQYDGTTVEVINTDAEGRLVLADGLSYAVKHLNPDYLVDIATLTGSATLGLSRQYAAVYGRNNKLIRTFEKIGERVGDRVWHMPLIEEYRVALESSIADLNHTAEKPDFNGGSITAALFLEHFAKNSNWVHFDIAGPARSDGDTGENPKGGTGFGTRLLIEWIASL